MKPLGREAGDESKESHRKRRIGAQAGIGSITTWMLGIRKLTETENAHRTLRSMMRECRELDPWRFFNPPGEKEG
jgi:hypothetical protein